MYIYICSTQPCSLQHKPQTGVALAGNGGWCCRVWKYNFPWKERHKYLSGMKGVALLTGIVRCERILVPPSCRICVLVANQGLGVALVPHFWWLLKVLVPLWAFSEVAVWRATSLLTNTALLVFISWVFSNIHLIFYKDCPHGHWGFPGSCQNISLLWSSVLCNILQSMRQRVAPPELNK